MSVYTPEKMKIMSAGRPILGLLHSEDSAGTPDSNDDSGAKKSYESCAAERHSRDADNGNQGEKVDSLHIIVDKLHIMLPDRAVRLCESAHALSAFILPALQGATDLAYYEGA